MKMAIADVVTPNKCRGVDTGEGSSTPTTDTKMPTTIDKIKGVLESPEAICFKLSNLEASPAFTIQAPK
jgi:hypothetical protein